MSHKHNKKMLNLFCNQNKLTRRNFLKSAAGSAAAMWLGPGLLNAATSRKKPNVLFLLPDQWRFSSFSHGEINDKLVQTPNLDKFVQEGARWRKAYATCPVCSPERATIMTGRYPHQTGMMANNKMLPPGDRCLAEIFKEAGYATHYVGKTHYDGEAKPGFIPKGWRRRGFTTYEGFNRGHNYTTGQIYFDNDGNEVHPTEYEPKTQTDLAINFMKQNQHRPFFCYLSWGPPHTPYDQIPAQYRHYNVSESDRRANVPAGNPAAGELNDYFAQCEALDDQFGRLMSALKQLGLDKNTLVIFTSDHGDMHESQSLWYKRVAFEESLHVPMFMRWPEKIPGETVTDTLISGIDIMPTVAGLCGLDIPKTCTGIDKSSAMFGETPPNSDAIYCEEYDIKIPSPGKNWDFRWRCVVTDQYKLVVDDSPVLDINSVVHLYDLQADPYEINNLLSAPAYATIKQNLFDRLVQFRNETGDTFPKVPPIAEIFYEI